MEEDPGTKHETLAKRAKANNTELSEKVEAIPLQDQMLRHSHQAAEIFLGIYSYKLSSKLKAMKFALNAASNTLPHNNNLHGDMVWWLICIGYIYTEMMGDA